MSGPVYTQTDPPRAYVRFDGKMFEGHAFGPKSPGHTSIGFPCPACGVPFAVGDVTTLVPLGPGGDEEGRERARSHRWYDAVAIEVHYACVTGDEL